MEGFRVLTLLYRTNELPPEAFQRLKELFEKYRAIASLYFWALQNDQKDAAELALRCAEEELAYYWHKVFDERSPLYLFNEVKEIPEPRKQILKFPLMTTLHYHHGAYISDNEDKLIVRLGGERLELPLPERALSWLKKKEREVAPLKPTKTVRIQWREDKDPEALKVQIVLRVERPKPPKPNPKEALLCFVDVNSAYGIAAIFASFDGERVCVHETLKLKPPNRGRRLKEAAKRQRAAAYGSKPNVNYALARLTMKFDPRGWVKATVAEIFKKAFAYAKSKNVLMNFDIPDSETMKNNHLQRTLLSIRKVAENMANWYGVYVTFKCYSSHRCPICGGS